MKNTAREFDWWEQNVTSEIYLNTERHDWWKACDVLAKLFGSAHSLVDIGGGDGHTLWQVLSAAYANGAKFKEILFVEPSAVALKRAHARLSQLKAPVRYMRGTLEKFGEKIARNRKEKFDMLYAGHVNYYFGKQAGGDISVQAAHKALALLPRLAKTIVIMTAPKHSDYYKVVDRNPFSKLAYAEAVERFYRSRGYAVRSIPTPIRFYVAHAHQSPHEAAVLWKFFNDSEVAPTAPELKRFLVRLKSKQDKNGYINFKDRLVVVSGQTR
jgi:hypothetical protein